MPFFGKVFSKPEKPDYFADKRNEIERLAAAKDSSALIALMGEVQKYRPAEIADFATFSQKRNNTAYQAALALAQLGDLAGVEPVIECVKAVLTTGYGDKGCWWSVSPQIAARFGPVALDPLILRLEKDELGGTLGDFAASALGLIGDQRAMAPLLAGSRRTGGDKTYFRPMGIWALGVLGEGREVVEMLVSALLYDQSGRKSQNEAEALFALGSGRFGKLAEEVLLPLLSDQKLSSQQRHQVAQALCAMGNAEGLERCLRESSPADLVLLGRFNDERVAQRLASFLDGPHNHDALSAAWFFAALGLAQQGDRRAVRPLVEGLTIPEWGRTLPHPWYHQTMHDLALGALKSLGNTALEELTGLSKDSDERIRSQAVALLPALQAAGSPVN